MLRCSKASTERCLKMLDNYAFECCRIIQFHLQNTWWGFFVLESSSD